MRPDHAKLFLRSAGCCFVLTLTYPVALFANSPDNWKYYLGVDVAWSIFVCLFFPVCAGVITVLISDLFQYRIPKQQWMSWAIGLSIFSGLIAWGAWQDNNRLPPPPTIAAVNGVPIGDYAVRVDQCLREKAACGNSRLDQVKLLSQVDHCDLINSPDIVKLLGSTEPSSSSKIYAYLCALFDYALSRSGDANDHTLRITFNTVAYVAAVLKWVVYTYITIYIVCLFYHSVPTFKINPATLTGLITAWSILVLWFPLRLFSDWLLWYEDLDHLITGDAPLFLSLAFAIICFIMIVIDFVVTFGRLDPMKTISAAYGVIAVILGLFITIKPKVITLLFHILYSFDISLVIPGVLLLFGIITWHAYAFVMMPTYPVGNDRPTAKRRRGG